MQIAYIARAAPGVDAGGCDLCTASGFTAFMELTEADGVGQQSASAGGRWVELQRHRPGTERRKRVGRGVNHALLSVAQQDQGRRRCAADRDEERPRARPWGSVPGHGKRDGSSRHGGWKLLSDRLCRRFERGSGKPGRKQLRAVHDYRGGESLIRALSTDHDYHGIFVLNDPQSSSRGKREGLQLMDVAPTVLEKLQVEVPKDMRGKIID